MTNYWVTFHGRGAGCVGAESEQDALRIGEEVTGYATAHAVRIPYPADPRINPRPEDPYYCPSFCYQPVKYAALGRCAAVRPCDD
jgi:hypothetical protein